MPKPPPICCYGLIAFFILLSIRGIVQPEQQYSISSVIGQPGLASSEIYSVGQDADGFIWIGTNIGISRFDGSSFKNYSTVDTVRIQRVSTISTVRNGKLYFGGYGGLFYVEHGKIFNIPLPFAQSEILCIHLGPHGGLWIGGNNLPPTYLSPAVLSQPSSAEIKPFFSKQTWSTIADNQSVYSLETDSEGNLYLGTLNKLLKYDGDDLEVLWSDGTQNYFLRSIIAKTPDSIYWGGMKTSLRFMQPQGYNILVDYFLVNSINTSTGIYALLNNVYRQTKNGFQLEVDLDHFRDCWYQSFMQDQEGNFWIGAHNDLLKISPTPFKVYSTATHSNMDQLYSVNETKDGNILLGGHRGRIHLFQEERFTRLLPNDQRVVPRAEVLAMHLSKQDDIWFGSAYEGVSLLRDDKLHRFTKANGLEDNACYFFHEDQNGELWSGGDYAITRIRENAEAGLHFDHFSAAGFDKLAPRFYAATTDQWGNLWAGSSVGLFLLNEGQLELWPFPEPLASNPIITHIVGDKKGNVWMSTQGDGLWQGRFVTSKKLEITKRWSKPDGLNQDSWLGLHVDQQDRVWVANDKEICCLNPIDSSQLFCYNRNDGWPEFSPRFIQFHESQDSIIWIVGQSVLIRFSPYQLNLNTLPPKAFIENVELMGTDATIFDYVKDKERSFPLPKDLHLPYNRNFLRFYFTSTSQVNPEKNRFKYRLVGTDASWQLVGEMETRSVAYPNL